MSPILAKTYPVIEEPIYIPTTDWTLYDLYAQMEMPIVPLIDRMMEAGMGVDVEHMRRLAERYQEEKRVHNDKAAVLINADRESFNLGSPDQVRKVLFEDMRLRPVKYTPNPDKKTGARVPSTDDETLTRLLENLDPDLHRLSSQQQAARAFCEHVSEYRRFDKLDGTYAGKIVVLATPAPDSRIFTTLNQTRAASGRLTSSEPFNFQNFPNRDPEEAKEFRKGFVPRPGYSILKMDFSQIELRVAAHNSQDPGMMQRFIDDEDLHAATASLINNIEIGAVTKDQRSASKTVGFGALYGLTDRGLVPKLPKENRNIEYAGWFLKRFWEVYPKVAAEVHRVQVWIRRYGWVADDWGRLRMIPEIRSAVERIQAEGLREGFNHTIQGTAQGVIKIPMGKTLGLIERYGLDCTPLIQIHDEMDFEVRTDQLMDAAELLGVLYASAVAIDVPVKVEVESGSNWGEMHKIMSVSVYQGEVTVDVELDSEAA